LLPCETGRLKPQATKFDDQHVSDHSHNPDDHEYVIGLQTLQTRVSHTHMSPIAHRKHITFSVYLACIDFIEHSHENECVEDHRQMLRGLTGDVTSILNRQPFFT
jgi:hypothetical protein